MPESQILRHIRLPDHLKLGKVAPRAFKFDADDVGRGISVTRCEDRIVTETQIDDYVSASCQHPAGTLGVCFVNESQASSIDLEIQADPLGPVPYESLHCLLKDNVEENLCPGELKRRQLAEFATKNGRSRPVIVATIIPAT